MLRRLIAQDGKLRMRGDILDPNRILAIIAGSSILYYIGFNLVPSIVILVATLIACVVADKKSLAPPIQLAVMIVSAAAICLNYNDGAIHYNLWKHGIATSPPNFISFVIHFTNDTKKNELVRGRSHSELAKMLPWIRDPASIDLTKNQKEASQRMIARHIDHCWIGRSCLCVIIIDGLCHKVILSDEVGDAE